MNSNVLFIGSMLALLFSAIADNDAYEAAGFVLLFLSMATAGGNKRAPTL